MKQEVAKNILQSGRAAATRGKMNDGDEKEKMRVAAPPQIVEVKRRWRTRARGPVALGCKPHRTRVGATLNFEALSHAPLNESGVVFLFGMLAHRLGFVVQGLRSGFPDCEALRRMQREKKHEEWEWVRIEFEFESRNFLYHGHKAEECDLIVCWTHNWKECPLEVIALREEIAMLQKEA